MRTLTTCSTVIRGAIKATLTLLFLMVASNFGLAQNLSYVASVSNGKAFDPAYPASKLNDTGPTRYDALNGYAVVRNSSSQPLRIVMDFTQPSDVSRFRYWNNINWTDNGLESFRIEYFDASGNLLTPANEAYNIKTFSSGPGTGTAATAFEEMVYAGAGNGKDNIKACAKRAILTVLAINPNTPIDRLPSRAEIRQIEFEGTPCNDLATEIKKFEKSVSRQCDKVAYTLKFDIGSDGKKPDKITLKDIWPAGLLPASDVTFSGSPAVGVSKSMTATGWSLEFMTASGSGLVNGTYSVSFTSTLNPAALAGGNFKLVNSAEIRSANSGRTWRSDDPSVAGDADDTVLAIDTEEIRNCKKDDVVTEGGCVSRDVKVSCGKIPGTYVITFDANDSGASKPKYVEISVLTPGVSIKNPKPKYLVGPGGKIQLTLVGANPGDVVEFDISGSRPDPKSGDGMSICCVGKIKVTIPKDLDCVKPRIDIVKNCGPVRKSKFAMGPAIDAFGYNAQCTITVTTQGPQSGLLHVADAMVGGTAHWLHSTSTPNWNCSGAVCTINGSSLNPVSSVSTFAVTASFANVGDIAEAKNCAKVTGAKKPSCVPFKFDEGKLTVTKKTVIESAVAFTQSFPITTTCNGNAVNGTVSDASPFVQTNLPIGASCTVVENATTPPAGLCRQGWVASWKTTYVPSTPVTITVAGATVAITNELECKPETKGDIKITKVCDPAVEIIGAINSYQSVCHITVTTTGPQSGTISVNDQLTGVSGPAVTSMTSTTTPAWACSGTNCSINGSALNQTSSTSVIDATVSFPSQGHVVEVENCATATVGGVEAGKSCTPFTAEAKKPKLTIVKKGLENCQPGAPCPFTVTITSVGQPYTGNVALVDVLTPNHAWPVTAISPNVCGGAVGSTPFVCVAPMNLAADTPFTFTVTLNPVTMNSLERNENCIRAVAVDDSVPTGPMSNADAQNLLSSSQTLSTPVDSCWPFGSKRQLTRLQVKKEALYNGEHIASQSFPITVTCDGSIKTGTVADGSDYFTPGDVPVGSTCKVTETPTTPAAGLCPPNTTASWATSYAPASQVQATAGLTTVTITNRLDCKPVVIKVDPPKCDRETAKLVGKECRCTIDGMVKVSATACRCPGGTELRNGKCREKRIECPPRTHLEGKRCMPDVVVCKKPLVRNPKTNTCVAVRPVCKRDQRYDKRTNTCVTVRIECPKGTVFNRKRQRCEEVEQRCPEGTIKGRGGRCIVIPRCRTPLIPMPGTNRCINPFEFFKDRGHGGKGEGKDRTCDDNGIPVPC